MTISFGGRKVYGRVYLTNQGSNLLGWWHQKDLNIILDPKAIVPVMSTTVHDVNSSYQTNLMEKYPDVFSDDLGKRKNFSHKSILKKNAIPVVHKVRNLPYLMRGPLQDELTKLLAQGVIEPIEASEWLAFIVVAPKDGGKKIRLCVDMRDLNKNIWVDRQSLPNISEMLTSMGGGVIFSVINMSSAYHQIDLDEGSRHLTSFVTPLGAFRYYRMPFGLASASAVFQRVMQQIFEGMMDVLCF